MTDQDNIKRLIESLENGDEASQELDFRSIFEDISPEFANGFPDRVMARIEEETPEKGMDYFLPRLFRWVAIAGVAAAVALLIMTYTAEDDISIDAFSGINQVTVEEVASLNF